MTVRHATLCAACARLGEPTKTGQPACEAFPGGIPSVISTWGADHRQPRNGDHGLQFVQAEGEGAAALFDNWLFVNEHDEWERRQGDGN
jgi:hypothetical protein